MAMLCDVGWGKGYFDGELLVVGVRRLLGVARGGWVPNRHVFDVGWAQDGIGFLIPGDNMLFLRSTKTLRSLTKLRGCRKRGGE
jgi:hypothetical protein